MRAIYVVIHYSTDGREQTVHELDRVGDQGLEVTEGTITHLDRGHKRITVRIGERRIETFQLTDRAAAETSKEIDGAATSAKVMIYYKDDHGQKVAHYFKKIS